MSQTWIIVISVALVPMAFYYLVKKPAAWIEKKINGKAG